MEKATITSQDDFNVVLGGLLKREQTDKKVAYTLLMLNKTSKPDGNWEAEFGIIKLEKDIKLNEIIAVEVIQITQGVN